MAIMKSEGPAVWYDRRVSPQLREALMPGGSLHRLITFARRRHLADVQLRKARSGSPLLGQCLRGADQVPGHPARAV